VKGEKCR